MQGSEFFNPCTLRYIPVKIALQSKQMDEQEHGFVFRKIPAPTREERWIIRGLVFLGVIAMALFVWWFADPAHIGNKPLYVMLTFAVGFRFLRLLHEWYHYLGVSVPEMPVSTRQWKVDMVTTFCPGEPYEMIIETLRAMKAVTYPHETYLCDEGDDPYIKQVCRELGVHHVYRGPEKKNAKAGNVNYCLEHHARGEIVVVLDPDHLPIPEFLDRVVPYFEDPAIGYVQCVQAYYNRNESFIAKAAAEQTYHFYGPMMMSMNSYGTAQAIGANCTFRREALDSIGGHAPGLSEDMHTAMRLHANGWKSLYVPEALSRGLVPASLSGFYKQQLKWTRGSLDLLVNVVPKLFMKLSWFQRIHYLTIPLYFLYGLIAIIDLSVPLAALITASPPWLVDMGQLGLFAAPLLLMTLIIRQFSQRWLLEEHERGFHFFGGAMLIGTWWIFLTGFFYTLLNIKVPYIPTPKDDKPTNEWRLSIPNILTILVSAAVVWYGLRLDWSPYSVVMASFAGVNIFFLSVVVIISQRKLLQGLYDELYGGRLSNLRLWWYFLLHRRVYQPMRNMVITFVLVLVISGATGFYLTRALRFDPDSLEFPEVTPSEGFYFGKWGGSTPFAPHFTSYRENPEDIAASMGLIQLPWANEDTGRLSLSRLDSMEQKGVLPVVVWDIKDSLTWKEIASGAWDDYLGYTAEIAFSHGDPLLVCLPVLTGPNVDTLYRAGFAYIADFFQRQGVSNVSWVWYLNTDLEEPLYYFPSGGKVRYMALKAPASADDPESWIKVKLRELPRQLPVLIMGDLDPSRVKPLLQEFPMVQAWIFSGSNPDLSGGVPSMVRTLGKNYQPPTVFAEPAPAPGKSPQRAAFFEHSPEKGFVWKVDGKPFYVKGVAYNPGHDWHDGESPLVQSVLERDMQDIKAMGANTIRRYAPGIYDYNITREAGRQGMKVIYGFWFDPQIDYYKDTAAVTAYRKEVVERVRKFQDDPSIIAWGIGNETWGIMKHYFRPAYLVRVRNAYLRMLETMAQDIQAIDGTRPVFTSMEHSRDLASELRAVRRLVPSLDFVGINSYFEMQIRHLDSLCTRHYPGKPYLVTEFGPEGYWDVEYTEKDEFGHPKEPADFAKAANYAYHWQDYVQANQGHNLGGVAFCWKDRMEETISWFGLTDFKNRKKPGYYTLQSVWTGKPFVFPMEEIFISHPWQVRGRVDIKLITSMLDTLPDNLRFEWSIREDNMLRPMKNFKVLEGGRKI
jgi:cellulose synthase/poly-beta-1,6-N-acetylglucosamine synthase-like glycosyltransferase